MRCRVDSTTLLGAMLIECRLLRRAGRRCSTPQDGRTIIPAIRRGGGAAAWRRASDDGDREREVLQESTCVQRSGQTYTLARLPLSAACSLVDTVIVTVLSEEVPTAPIRKQLCVLWSANP